MLILLAALGCDILRTKPSHSKDNTSMSTRRRAVSVLFEEGEYAGLVRKATELTLN